MSVEIRSLAEINQKATDILIREMGVVDALRFLHQFNVGAGDYTRDREQWLGDLSLEQITTAIKARRNNNKSD